MAEGTTEDASSGYRDSIVTYSTNAEDSSGIESDSTSQRDSYTTNNSSQAENFHNSNSEVPRISKNLDEDDEDDEDDPKKARNTPFYKKKRFWAIFCVVSIVFFAIMIPISLLVIFPAIVQKTMDRADINLDSVVITNPQEGSFQMNMKGSVTNGGPYNAKVEYPDPVDVYYQGSLIGSMNLDNMNIKGGNAILDSQDKLFTIKDSGSLIAFTGGVMLSESVEWELKGNAKITALGLTKNHLKLNKKIVLNGANGFQNTTVKNLTIQQNATTNKLDLTIVATMFNPSPFGMQLGILELEVYYNNTLVAPVTTDPFTLVPGENEITMRGSIVPPTTDGDRANFESFMVSFINGKDGTATTKGVSSKPDSVNTVSWLNTIVKNLQLTAKLSAKAPSKIITGVDFGEMKLTFNGTNSFTPLISSNGTTASYQLPFQVQLNVTQVTQNISIYTQDMIEIASIVTGSVNATNDASKIYLNIPPTPFLTPQTDVGKLNFQEFLKNLTIGKSLDLYVIGTSDVTANTVIGPLTLNGIPLNTTTTLVGFQGLAVKPPTISNLTVTGGTKSGLTLGLNVDLFNPTNFSLDLGSVNFQMIYNGEVIGIATIPDLALHPADTILPVVATLDPNGSDAAKEILNSYVNGTASTLQITGYNGSSTIESLSSALTSITISSELPPLSVKLLGKSSLEFTSDTITNGGLAKASVELINPFAVDLSISSIRSTLGFHGEELGVLNLDHLSSPIVAAKDATSLIHDLPVKLNVEPNFLFGVLRQSAQDAGLDLTPIDVLLTLGGFTDIKGFEPIDLTKIDPSIFKNFNAVDYSKKALSAMLIDINMVSTIAVGDYSFELAYIQYGISSSVDDSVSFLITGFSGPIVQKLMDASSMSFDKIFIQDPSETAFTSLITGTVSNTGPFDATISFPDGASLSFNDKELGTMTLPDIAASNGKASLNNLQSQFKVTDTQALADFTIQVLMTKSATWTMSTQNAVVTAVGLTVPNIKLVKTVTLTGSEGFQNGNGIKLLNFTLLGPVPEGGLAAAIKTSLTNDATLGIELGTINYNVYYNGTFVGPAESDNVVMLPHDTSILNIGTRILPPTSQQQAELLSGLFKLLFAGESVPFQTVGDSVITKNGPVSWLTAAIQKVNIVLPIQGPKMQDQSVITVDATNITGITADSFDVHMVGSISKTGPFPITLSYPSGVDVFYGDTQIGNVKMAPVNITPPSDTKMDNDGPFSVTNQQGMTIFTGDLLGKESLGWELKTNDSTITIGGIPITGMPFDKQVGFLGFNGLKDGIKMNNITFGIGKNKELDLIIDTTIINPSNTGIEMGTVVFDTFIGENDDVPFTPITATNVVLAPKADNKAIFTGQITDLSVLLQLLKVKQPTLKAVGKSVDPPKAGGNPVPWLQIPFSKLEFKLPVDPKLLPDFTNVIQSIQINDMSLTFTPDTAFDPSSSSKSISATVKMPIPLPVKTVEQDIVIIDEDNSAVASLHIPKTPVTIDQNNTMTFSYQNIPLKAVDPQAFAKFILELTAAVDKSFSLVGNATTDVLPIPIPFNVKSSLKGLQGLKSSPVTLGGVEIKEGTPKSLNLLTTVTLTNPSNVQIDAGGAAFGIFAGDAQVSTAVMSGLKLANGPNTLPTEVQIPPAKSGNDIVALFLGNFLAGGKSPLNIKNGVTDVKSLQPTFSLLQLETILNGMPKPLINNVAISISSTQGKPSIATLSVTNLLNKDVTIDSIDLTISDPNGNVIATASIPALPQKPVLKTGQPIDLPVPVTIKQNDQPKTVNVVLISGVSIESHDTIINYKQNGIPSTITGSSSSA